MSELEDVWESVQINTSNYKFELQYKAKIHSKKVYDAGHLFVGNEENPCLSITFNLPGLRELNSRFTSTDISVAHLNKIKNMKECILEDKTNSSQSSHSSHSSFAKEMLDAVIVEIKRSFPFIHHIKLRDSSYIPCDGDADTLDLLFYNIALYKKTWYEQTFNAYFVPRDTFIQYKCAIENYATIETKSAFSWVEFYNTALGVSNYYAQQQFRNNIEKYEALYNNSKTFPDFFVELSKTIPKKDKCKFFKDWLESFLQDNMKIQNIRVWYIDLYTVEKRIQRGGSSTLNKTHKRNHIKTL
jgi:hypothetical protein